MIKLNDSVQLPVSAIRPVPFTPSHYEGTENPPVYLIKVPDLLERADLNHEITCRAGRYITDEFLTEKLKDCINDIVAEDQKAELIELVNQHQYELEQRQENPDHIINAELLREIAALEDSMNLNHPHYRELTSLRTRWLRVAPVIAAQMFLLGQKNGATYQRHAGRVIDAVLQEIPQNDLIEIGYFIMSSTRLSESQRKNSDSPSH